VSRFAADISDHELGDYQRSLRLMLRHGLVTATWPDPRALPRVRRFSATLRRDLADAFGYRLELHGSTARLVRTMDLLDDSQPARARRTSGGPGRVFDRRRYAYLMLCLAVLGRAGVQITLSELADSVAADAGRIPGLGLDSDQASDRRALVDAVGWLEERGALTIADGSASAWAAGSAAGEALYDVARDVGVSLYRPTRMVQAVTSVRTLLAGAEQGIARSGNEERRLAAQAARRAVAERPVVYFRDVPEAVANHLRGSAIAEDLARLTGLRVERRAEGVLLVDTAGLSAERFPGTGTVAQVAVLLAVEMADRVVDPDGRRVRRVEPVGPQLRQEELADLVDAGLPEAGRLDLPVGGGPSWLEGSDDADEPAEREPTSECAGSRLPFIPESLLRSAVAGLVERYGASFKEDWRNDPEQLRAEAVDLLARFGCLRLVPGGVLVLPLIGRYRNTTATMKARSSPKGLF
jgi:uncharacterized protein (TIGR02678 family)